MFIAQNKKALTLPNSEAYDQIGNGFKDPISSPSRINRSSKYLDLT